MIVKLLTEHHLEFLSLKGGCTDSSESTHVKMPRCWKSHARAHIMFKRYGHGVLVLIGSHLMNLEGRDNKQADSR